MRHLRDFHRSTLTWRKGTKNSRIINEMIHKLQTGILVLLSNTILMSSPESLSIVTWCSWFYGCQGRIMTPGFRKSRMCWWHQERRRHEVIFLHTVRLLSHSGWHVWMSENLSREPRIIFKYFYFPPFQSSFWNILLVVICPFHKRQQRSISHVLTT